MRHERRHAQVNAYRHDGRGSASIELVILLPALLVVMLLGMQAALYHHARTVAIAAAEEGARAAGAENGHQSDGVAAADAFIATAGDSVLEDASTTASRTATAAQVTVHGYAMSVIPGWRIRVTHSSSVTVERVTAPTAESP